MFRNKKIESCLFSHSDLFWPIFEKIINLSLKINKNAILNIRDIKYHIWKYY